jgi:hypothetical protein
VCKESETFLFQRKIIDAAKKKKRPASAYFHKQALTLIAMFMRNHRK